jgi:hypothetical protein
MWGSPGTLVFVSCTSEFGEGTLSLFLCVGPSRGIRICRTVSLFAATRLRSLLMHMHNLNLLAVLVAAISTMVVGFVWYSPVLFAKPWMREMGYDPNDKSRVQEMQKSAGPAYLGSFVASLVSAFVLALFLHQMRVQSLELGLLVGAHVWLGFVATVQLTGVLFMKQSMKLFAINTGYQLVCYLVMGTILGVWR